MRVNDTVDLVEKNLLAEVMGDLIYCDHYERCDEYQFRDN